MPQIPAPTKTTLANFMALQDKARRNSFLSSTRSVQPRALAIIPGMKRSALFAILLAAAVVAVPLAQNPPSAPANPRLDALKAQALAAVDSRAEFSQQMVDQIFSYGELGFQEVETNRYLIDVLKKNGFAVQEGVAGVPTAFVATWGSGKPVIALGSDIDCIPQASQKPGV